MIIRNTFVIFVVSGFWHGANWTFLAWGFLNAVYFLPLMLLKQNRKNLGLVAEGKLLPNIREFIQIAVTFTITVLAWIFFRADSISHAFSYLQHLVQNLFVFPKEMSLFAKDFVWIWIVILIIAEWLQRDKQHALQIDTIKAPRLIKWGVYYSVIFLIFYFGGSQQEFIYFQF